MLKIENNILIHCEKNAVEIEIPYGVTEIGEGAFSDCAELKKVYLPETVTIIGERAFSGCIRLREIDLPYSVTVIKKKAFFNCKSLGYINIPDGVTRLESGCFMECGGVSKISLPDSVTYISSDTFLGILSYTEFEASCRVKELYMKSIASNMLNNFYKIKYSMCVFCACLLADRNNLKDISAYIKDIITVFGTDIVKYIIDNRNSAAMEGFIRTSTYIFSNDLEQYIEMANSCASIRSMLMKYKAENYEPQKTVPVFDEALDYIEVGGKKKVDTYDNFNWQEYFDEIVILRYLGNEEKVIIPNYINGYPVTIIGQRAFAHSYVKEIQLPSCLKTIENRAFYHSKYLKRINMPETLNFMEEGAFEGCISLESIALPDSIKFVPEKCFSNCISLERADFGKNIEIIGKNAFYGCQNLESVELEEGLKFIDENAFRECSNIFTLDLPTSLERIGATAFLDCCKIQTLYIAKSLKKFGIGAFSGCNKIWDYNTLDEDLIGLALVNGVLFSGEAESVITVPSVTERIEDYAFYSDKTIEELIIKEGTKRIGHESFAYCSNLKSVTIPLSVCDIEEDAFDACPNIRMYGPRGSYAERFADSRCIPFFYK